MEKLKHWGVALVALLLGLVAFIVGRRSMEVPSVIAAQARRKSAKARAKARDAERAQAKAQRTRDYREAATLRDKSVRISQEIDVLEQQAKEERAQAARVARDRLAARVNERMGLGAHAHGHGHSGG